jgi:hypothetical protein
VLIEFAMPLTPCPGSRLSGDLLLAAAVSVDAGATTGAGLAVQGRGANV